MSLPSNLHGRTARGTRCRERSTRRRRRRPRTEFRTCKKITEDSRSSGSFFTQVDHLFSTNCFSKPAMNFTDFSTLKILTQSD